MTPQTSPSSTCKDRVLQTQNKMWAEIEQAMLPATVYSMLAISALWSFLLHFSIHFSLTLGFLTFGIFFATGVLGTWHYINIYKRLPSPTISSCLKISKFLSNLYILPLLVSDLYMKYNFSIELIIAHLILPLLALAPYGSSPPVDRTVLFKKFQPASKVRDTLDFVTFCCVVSLMIISTLASNVFGIAAAFVYAVTHFIITEEGYVDAMKMPAEPIYISGMGIFCLLSTRAMIAR